MHRLRDPTYWPTLATGASPRSLKSALNIMSIFKTGLAFRELSNQPKFLSHALFYSRQNTLRKIIKVFNIVQLTNTDLYDGEDGLREEGRFQHEVIRRVIHTQESYGRQTGQMFCLARYIIL